MTKKSLASIVHQVSQGLHVGAPIVAPLVTQPSKRPYPPSLASSSQLMSDLGIWGSDKYLFPQRLVKMLYEADWAAGLRTEGNGRQSTCSYSEKNYSKGDTDEQTINSCILKSLQGYQVTLVGEDTLATAPDALKNLRSARKTSPVHEGITDVLSILRIYRSDIDKKSIFDVPESTSNILNFLDPKDAAGFEHETIQEFLEVADALVACGEVQSIPCLFVVDGSKPISSTVVKHAALVSLMDTDETARPPTLCILNAGNQTADASVHSFAKSIERDFGFKIERNSFDLIPGCDLVCDRRDAALVNRSDCTVITSVDSDPLRLAVQHFRNSHTASEIIRMRYSNKRIIDCKADNDDSPGIL